MDSRMRNHRKMEKFNSFATTKTNSTTTITECVCKIFGFLPFSIRQNGNDVTAFIPRKWLVISYLNFTFLAAVLLITAFSYATEDFHMWEGLVAEAWIMSPILIIFQGLAYQAIIFLHSKCFLEIIPQLRFLSKTLKAETQPITTKITLPISIIFSMLLPLISYFSSCTTIEKAKTLLGILKTSSCTVTYNKVSSEIASYNTTLYILIMVIQGLSLIAATLGSWSVEQWMIETTEVITNLFQYSQDKLHQLLLSSWEINSYTFNAWMSEYLCVQHLGDSLEKTLSPVLLLAAAINSLLLFLQAFWLAERSHEAVFTAWGSAYFPIAILLTTFFRTASLAVSGQKFMEQANRLSQMIPAISENSFYTDARYQMDLLLFREVTMPLILTACQFVTFGKLLLTTVVGAIATYIIIFNQMSEDIEC